MKPRGKKNTSKRKSLSLQHKISRKSCEKGRKQRKEARRLKKSGISLKRKKPKNAGIPSLWPFKQEELLEAKRRQDAKEENHKKMRELQIAKKRADKKSKQLQEKKELTRRNLAKGLDASGKPLIQNHLVSSTVVANTVPLGQSVKEADLMIITVDARDVNAFRNVNTETLQTLTNKMIVLTRGDLIPLPQLQKWTTFLRKETGLPVIPLIKKVHAEHVLCHLSAKQKKILTTSLKASSTIGGAGGGKAHGPMGGIGDVDMLSGNTTGGSDLNPSSLGDSVRLRKKALRPVGFSALQKLLGNSGFNASKRIAIVGYPGSGKKTVHSYLKMACLNLSKKTKIFRSHIWDPVKVEAESGGNLNDQGSFLGPEIGLDPTSSEAFNCLRDLQTLQDPKVQDLILNSFAPQSVKQPLLTLKRLLERCINKEQLQVSLSLPAFTDVRGLLEQIAKQYNLDGLGDAARRLLKMWRGMRNYVECPVKDIEKNEDSDSAAKLCTVKCLTTSELTTLYKEIDVELHNEWVNQENVWGRDSHRQFGLVVGNLGQTARGEDYNSMASWQVGVLLRQLHSRRRSFCLSFSVVFF